MTVNLKTKIEEYKIKAEKAMDENEARRLIIRGVQYLKRYFLLIVFQSYLEQTNVNALNEMESFNCWIKRHLEIIKMMDEMEEASSIGNIQILSMVDSVPPGAGIALTTEVLEVVKNRKGKRYVVVVIR
ncbi:hypothetical protein O9G_006412 [Rozella allomycis CSF55]|uniref:Uncharacterized protein n=1 Tax=Rozella allomycis (strain CSF55) TaxID=988480 RepID=A0A075AMX7_ROZAC|nr:hypothetical protein O9G_006412 [Rozella allomycis CSF55]|eukprot:EPZ31084.1 hypothetical protein O9G_006412 [Rozella allomycis CSF55]